MQIEHDDNRNFRAGHTAHDLEQVTVGIVGAFGQRRAMARDEHRIERQRGLQAGFDLVEVVAEETFLDGPARLGQRNAERHRRPVASTVHLGEEARQVWHGDRRAGARFAHDAVAADVDVLLEVGRRGDRRETIALDGEAENGYSRVVLGQHFLLKPARKMPQPAPERSDPIEPWRGPAIADQGCSEEDQPVVQHADRPSAGRIADRPPARRHRLRHGSRRR